MIVVIFAIFFFRKSLPCTPHLKFIYLRYKNIKYSLIFYIIAIEQRENAVFFFNENIMPDRILVLYLEVKNIRLQEWRRMRTYKQ